VKGQTVCAGPSAATTTPFLETASAFTTPSAVGRERSLVPLPVFHILTILSSAAVSKCEPLGVVARARTGVVAAATERTIESVSMATVLSAPADTTLVLLLWKTTDRTAPPRLNDSSSLPVAIS